MSRSRPTILRTPEGVPLTVTRTGTCPACRCEVALVFDPSLKQLRLVHERALCTGFDRDPESDYGQAVVWPPRRGAS